jgi:hypothetical protein
MPVLKKYTGYLVQVLSKTRIKQVLKHSTGYYYEPNKKTRAQCATTIHVKLSTKNTTYNLQYKLCNSQGQEVTTDACRGYLISGLEIM